MPPEERDPEVPPHERLRAALRQRPPHLLSSAVKAAIAVLFDPSEPQILFIRRAEHPRDPWSGHIAFPGGKQDEGDRDLLATALREAREEIGFDMARADYLGQLDDLHTNISPLVVSGFAYSTPRQQPRLSQEVEDCFWVPLSHLSDTSKTNRPHCSRASLSRTLPGSGQTAAVGDYLSFR